MSLHSDLGLFLISIHALREEGDSLSVDAKREIIKFLSTPSARRATRKRFDSCWRNYISIHALREEGDKNRKTTNAQRRTFLSTPSARRATAHPAGG